MQKYIGICSLILLAACSSDSGGGLNDGWLNIRQGGFSTGMKTVSQSERTAYLNGKITGERNQDTNKAAFDNMYDVLLGNVTVSDPAKLLDAIAVANPGIEYEGDKTNADDIRTWINDNKDKLESAARETYMKYGLFLTDVDFNVSDSTVGSKMNFTLNGTNISGVKIDDTTYGYSNSLFRQGGPNSSKGASVMGGVKSNELQYANFGRIIVGDIKNNRIDATGAKYATYYGGYDKLKKETFTPTESTTFTGGAAGFVHGTDGGVLSVGGDATFVVDTSGKGTLSANFGKDWYNIEVVDQTITFDSTGKNIADQYKHNADASGSVKMEQDYYGAIGGDVSEVVGSVVYDEGDSGIKLDAVFGGKK